jgi:hypothetical protein
MNGNEGVFEGEGCYQLSKKAANVCQPQRTSDIICTKVQRVQHTSRFYPKGIPKSSVRLCGPVYVRVLFVERTYDSPLEYTGQPYRTSTPEG